MSDAIPPTVLFSDDIAGTARLGTVITYTLTFDEPVSGLESNDFLVGNGSLGAIAGSGALWTVQVTPLPGIATGTISLTLKAAAVQYAAGNTNLAISNTTQAVDTVAPAAPRLVTDATFKALVDPQVMIRTSLGDVLLELDTTRAPLTVANMLAYVEDDYFADTLFHRVIAGFMVQGGGLTDGLVPKTPTYDPIPIESNNGLLNLRGTVAMARTNEPDSATSQFFINLVDNPFLNFGSTTSPAGYAVFGRVVSGMGVVDAMALVPTTSVGAYANLPVNDIVITSASQTVVGSSISTTGTFSVAGLEVAAGFEYSLDSGAHWLTGVGTTFTVPEGTYGANTIQVRQIDGAGNTSTAVARFADTLSVSSSHVVSANNAPSGSVLVSGVAVIGQSLSANINGLSDADGAGSMATPSYQWLRNGDAIAGATSASHVLGASDVGAVIEVRIRYTDALGRVEHLLSAAQTLGGDGGDNLLRGARFADSLSGQGGNDTLDGGQGANTLVGGAGDDIYIVDNTLDRVTEGANAGIDEIRSSVSFPVYPNALGANIEKLTLTGSANLYGIGNTLANTLVGNSGANVLIDIGGDDTLDGGAGNDTLDAGDGNDRLIGGSGNDSLSGGAGNDQFDGGTGLDTMLGGAGADTMDGGDGNDVYYVEDSTDVVIESNALAAGGIDTVVATVTYSAAPNIENILFSGAAATTGVGNSLANYLEGNAAQNYLYGGAGTDTMKGLDGNDIYYVDDSTDVVLETNALPAGGTDTVVSSVTYELGANLEQLLLSGNAAITGIGNATANYIEGNAAHNYLSGAAGADTMKGNDGNDVYYVDTSTDVVIETNNDPLTGGVDFVVSTVTYQLGSNVENLLLDGNAPITGIGSAVNNYIEGNNAANFLSGGLGADTMKGNDGNDVYYVDNVGDVVIETQTDITIGGRDTVSSTIAYALGGHVENLLLSGNSAVGGLGNGLANHMTGNAAANALSGQDGNDTLVGDQGTDTLTGGLGADTFDFNALPNSAVGTSRDLVTDFNPSEGDRIDLSGIDANSLLGGDQAFTFIGPASFGGAGQLRLAAGVLNGDVNGDGLADLEIHLTGITTLAASDFFL